MIVLLNGAFGVGKTTVARALARRLPRSIVFDPEPIGIALQRTGRLAGRDIYDFQDLPSWQFLTVAGLRSARLLSPNVIVPMAFSNSTYLSSIRRRIGKFDPVVLHFCLVAPVEVVHERLRSRGADPEKEAWEYQRASECCAVHGRQEFATQVSTLQRSVAEIVDELLALMPAAAG